MKQKLIIGTVLCALLIGLSIGPVWAAPAATNQIVHVVRWGENLIYIAGQYGTSVQAIMNANGLGNPNRIYAGQRLLIPGTAPAPAPTCGQVYVIQAGDTLSGIAYRFGISMYALVQANGIVNPNSIYYGQQLKVPCSPCTVPQQCPQPAPQPKPPKPKPAQPKPAQPGAGWWYVVQPGDTLAKLSWRYGVKMWDIVHANNLPNPNLICVGQNLFVPKPALPPPPPSKPATPGCEHLLAPRRGATLSGTVSAKGTADVENFWYYKLEFRQDGLDNWHYITGQHSAVENDVLGSWDTTTVPNGAYTFRLVVVDLTGNYPPPCEIAVHVKNN